MKVKKSKEKKGPLPKRDPQKITPPDAPIKGKEPLPNKGFWEKGKPHPNVVKILPENRNPSKEERGKTQKLPRF